MGRLAVLPQSDAIASIWHYPTSPGTLITSRPIFSDSGPLPAMPLPAFGARAIESRNRPQGRDGGRKGVISNQVPHFPVLQVSGLATSQSAGPAFACERNSRDRCSAHRSAIVAGRDTASGARQKAACGRAGPWVVRQSTTLLVRVAAPTRPRRDSCFTLA